MGEKEQQFVKKVVSRCFGERYSNLTTDFRDTTGDGYIGRLLFIQITLNNKLLDLVIKCSVEDEEQRKFVRSKHMFEREAYFYTSLYPTISTYGKEQLGYQLFSNVAQFYGAYFEDHMEALIFEDLNKAGYKLWDRRLPMDKNHVSMVLERYGKFHAVSLAMRHRHPQKFYDLTRPLKNSDNFVNLLCRPNLMATWDRNFQKIVSLLRNRGLDDAARRVDNFRSEIPDVLIRYADPDDRYSVVLHGDCWCNNFMFKYEEGSLKPTEVCFIDFQLCRLGSPLIEFSHYLYSSASKESFGNIDHYLQIYYDSLTGSLEKLGSDPEVVFPFNVLKEHWRKYSKVGLVMSIMLFKFMLCERDEAPNMTESQFIDDYLRPIRNEEELNRRMINVVTHFVDNNLI